MKLFKTLALVVNLTVFVPKLFAQSNKRLIAQLDSIFITDQQYRKIKNASPEQDKINMDKQAIVDRENLAKVENIFIKYGYPGKTLVGAERQSIAFLVIQHNDQEAQEKHLAMLTNAAAKGELHASSLAILIDRVRLGRGEKQLYGSQMHETKEGVKISPIEDEPNLNVRRAKIGMGPIAPYYKQWKIDYKVPVAGRPNPNPESIYYHPETREPSPVEAVGGDAAIFAKLVYPDAAKADKITGTVTIEYTVDKSGNTKNVFVVKGLGYGCDEEALRVIKEAKYINSTGEDAERRMRLPFPYKT